jgi:putative addiction module component (TIGR02574 family)
VLGADRPIWLLASRRLAWYDPAMGKPALDVSKLTADEKFDLIDDLWRSLSPEDLVLRPALRAELDRRLERLDRDGPVGVAWEDVYAEMASDEP